MNAKTDQFFAAGTTVVWIVDLERKTLRVLTPDVGAKVFHETDTLSDCPLLPGFTLAIADIFRVL